MSGLFFDCRYIRTGDHDGISRFSTGLFTEMFNQLANPAEVTAIISDLRQLEKLPTGTKYVKLSSPTSLKEPFIAFQLNRLGAKVVFSPMQTMGSLGRKFKLVLTIHDLIYYGHPAPPPGFNLAIRILWRLYHLTYIPQRVLLNRADAVVSVSETTKALIAKHRLTKRPVEVIYNAAASTDLSATVPAEQEPEQKILVYMGSFMDYKNVELLIAGMAQLPEYQLNLLSRVSDSRRRELELLIPAGAKVNFLNGVSEDEYHRQLLTATALVSSSRDEGFGIPLIEAMSRGIPVVVSDIPIFREIGGEAAIYFDLENPDAFAAAVKSIGPASNWKSLSKLSIAQAAKFDWHKSAKKLLKLLNQI